MTNNREDPLAFACEVIRLCGSGHPEQKKAWIEKYLGADHWLASMTTEYSRTLFILQHADKLLKERVQATPDQARLIEAVMRYGDARERLARDNTDEKFAATASEAWRDLMDWLDAHSTAFNRVEEPIGPK